MNIFDRILCAFAAIYPASFAKKLPADKCLHAIAGLAIGSAAALALPQWPSAAMAAATAGFLKEAYDGYRGHGWDKYDILATAIGGLLASPVCLVRM